MGLTDTSGQGHWTRICHSQTTALRARSQPVRHRVPHRLRLAHGRAPSSAQRAHATRLSTPRPIRQCPHQSRVAVREGVGESTAGSFHVQERERCRWQQLDNEIACGGVVSRCVGCGPAHWWTPKGLPNGCISEREHGASQVTQGVTMRIATRGRARLPGTPTA